MCTEVSTKFSGTSMDALRSQLKRQGVLFSYSGALNEAILYGIGQALQTHMFEIKLDSKVSRGLFSAFVEQVQNVIRYSSEEERTPGDDGGELDPEGSTMKVGILTIGVKPDGHRYVACGNLIDNTDVARIRETLEAIRGMKRKELSGLLREMLKKPPPEGSKGAGVGFISIAREADGNWDYDMVPTADGQHTFFCLEASF